jgi:hypothetical protein
MMKINLPLKTVSLFFLLSSSVSFAASDSTTLMMTQKDGETYLSWSTDIGSVVRQELYRSTTNSFDNAKLLEDVDTDSFVVEDVTTSSGQDYWYWVKVVDDQGEEHLSNVSSTTGEEPISSNSSSRCYAGATFKNETVDCGGVTIGSSCTGDDEDQDPVLTLKNATVKNVRISESGGADGIHCESGSCTLQNVIWEDVCEDAATNNGKTMTIKGGWAYNSKSGYGGKPDKIFQHNSKNSTTIIKGGFTAKGVNGKLYRSCGNCTSNGGPRYLKIDNVKIKGDIGSVAGINYNYKDVAKIRNLKIEDYKSGDPKVCVYYKGVQKGSSSPKVGEKWDTTYCDVSKSDVSKL